MKKQSLLLLVFVIFGCSGDNEKLVDFNLLLHNIQDLKQIRNEINNGAESRVPAFDKLISEAEAALLSGPFSVVYDDLVPPSGDKHDYASMGPYWWPNPDTPDGLPYIRRDGQVNPERIKYDKIPIATLGETVTTLALAYYFTNDERYAKRVTVLLRTWFIDPETRMNPNLNYGQFIPGRSAGRGVGIIESRVLIFIGEAIALINSSPAWTTNDQQQLTDWYSTYLNWLLSSPIGKDESDRENNHGTWFDDQVAYLALQTGRDDIANKYLNSIIDRRIVEQIMADGSQPYELERSRTLTYTKFNLNALTTAARLGEHLSFDIWNATNEQGGNIATALDFLVSNAVEEGPWPFEQITVVDNFGLISLLLLARDMYDGQRYQQALKLLPLADRIVSRENLLCVEPTWNPTEEKLETNADSSE